MAAWAGLGYYARARNLLACARAVAAEHGGRFPDDEAELRELPGIGAYTAAAIAAIAFGRRAVAVDGNVERVVARLQRSSSRCPRRGRKSARSPTRMTPDEGAGDFAQAMMDLGATICTPRNPDCGRCPLARLVRGLCARAIPPAIRVKAPQGGEAAPRRASPIGSSMTARSCSSAARQGPARRHARASRPTRRPPTAAWREAGAVDHVFTHFALTMRLLCAETPSAAPTASGGRSTGSAKRACRPCSPSSPRAAPNGGEAA